MKYFGLVWDLQAGFHYRRTHRFTSEKKDQAWSNTHANCQFFCSCFSSTFTVPNSLLLFCSVLFPTNSNFAMKCIYLRQLLLRHMSNTDYFLFKIGGVGQRALCTVPESPREGRGDTNWGGGYGSPTKSRKSNSTGMATTRGTECRVRGGACDGSYTTGAAPGFGLVLRLVSLCDWLVTKFIRDVDERKSVHCLSKFAEIFVVERRWMGTEEGEKFF